MVYVVDSSSKEVTLFDLKRGFIVVEEQKDFANEVDVLFESFAKIMMSSKKTSTNCHLTPDRIKSIVH